ncbi:MAG: hypothetical protein HKL85_06635 [Acidimicrobiaceae bacterium]|nr:hypothetical protein [Acidimicrobiaceae bacterium]
MIYCSHCGAGNIDDGSYCIRCGSRLGHLNDPRDRATSSEESAGLLREHHGDGIDDHSPITANTGPRRGAKKLPRWAVLAVALVVGGSVTAGLALHGHGRGPVTSAPKTRASPTSNGNYLNRPTALASDGRHLWVANGDNSITELNLSNGSLVRTIQDPGGPLALVSVGDHLWVANGDNSITKLNLNNGSVVRTIQDPGGPLALVSVGDHLWVANAGDSVAELNLNNGSLVRTISGAPYDFNEPFALASDGSHLWVANYNGSSITELNLSDGSLVRIISGASYGVNGPDALAADGTHLWVANDSMFYGNSFTLTELNLSDGSLVRIISGASYGFNYPQALASDGSHLWVANSGDSSGSGNANSITELNLNNGSLVRTISGGPYYFNFPEALASDGSHLWVANKGGSSVTELNSSNGSLVRTISKGS